MNEEHDIAQNDLASTNAKVPANVCYAQSFAVVKYVNAWRASHGAIVNVPTFLEKFAFKTGFSGFCCGIGKHASCRRNRDLSHT